MDDFIREYAKVKQQLNLLRQTYRDLRKKVLKQYGYTETTYKDLKDRAANQMQNAEEVSTEFGKVMRVKVPLFLHKNSKQISTQSYIYLKEN